MTIADYLDESRVRLDIELRSRKHALQVVSEIVAEESDSLSRRHASSMRSSSASVSAARLSSDGVALPHARLALGQ